MRSDGIGLDFACATPIPLGSQEDFFLFGPPCQPFTRLSSKRKREDYHPFASDERTKPFLDGARLIRLLVEMPNPCLLS